MGEAREKIEGLMGEIKALRAADTHELVRLKETEAMLLAAELMLRASLERTESRMSHFREDYDFRDDENWLAWIDITEENGAPVLKKTPIPTPIHPLPATKVVG